MRKMRRTGILAKGWLAILVVLIIVACGPTEETPAPSAMAPTATATEATEVTGPLDLTGPSFLPEMLMPQPKDAECKPLYRAPIPGSPYWVPGYVILTGPASAMEGALAQVRENLHADLTQVVRLDLAQAAAPLESGCDALSMFQLAEAPDLVMDLLRVCAAESETDSAKFADLLDWTDYVKNPNGYPAKIPIDLAVYLYLNKIGPQDGVYADLSFKTSLGGSPYSPMPSPWIADMADYEGADPASDFEQQWAFSEPRGINLIDQSGRRPEGPTGDRILVGVFDTSPFGAAAGSGTVDWLDPDMLVDVIVPPPYPSLAPEGTDDVREHGFFAAGLAHAVAPDSKIVLYRVLDDFGGGDLFTLDAALYDFISNVLELREDDSEHYAGAVINLSLGDHTPQDALNLWGSAHDLTGLGFPPDFLKAMRSLTLDEGQSTNAVQYTRVASLYTLLGTAYCKGIPVIAAAGNEADVEIKVRAQIPAINQWVLSVAASSYDREPSCFSNNGDVAAPGGDGQPPLPGTAVPGGTCQPALEECLDQTACKFALLGPISAGRSYRFWAGTSFAAPQVSGLAAQLLDGRDGGLGTALLDNRGSLTGAVYSDIRGNARELTAGHQKIWGDGVIDVRGSLP